MKLKISVIVVMFNEEDYIKSCLMSLLNQKFPNDSYEIILVDGNSQDNTVAIANNTVNEYMNSLIKNNGEEPVQISFFNNPARILATGWNIGIKIAKGSFVVRVDAHAVVAEDFLEKSINTIDKIKDAVCVGGSLETKSISCSGKIVEYVLSSPFGVGNSKFRYSKKEGYVDTVAYGLYRKEIFDLVGLFDEKLVRTQDNDMHRRIRDIGGRFYLNPDIKSTYFARNTFNRMIKQAIQNGKWTMINFLNKPGKMAIRHFIPFFFLVYLSMVFTFGIFVSEFAVVGLLTILLHMILGLIFGNKKSDKFQEIILIPFYFLFLHLSYGLGSFFGIFDKIKEGYANALSRNT